MLHLVSLETELPDGFDALRAEADAEGHRNMARLAEELAMGATKFEALLAATLGGELAGIGGMTLEPEPSAEPAIRMRRLYVAPRARLAGVGRALASALIQEAWDQVGLVTVHAGTPGAGRFWEAQAFRPVEDRPWSHELRRDLADI